MDKTRGPKSRPDAGAVSKTRSGSVSAGPFARPEARELQELQELVDESPRVQQLSVIQRTVDESPRVRDAARRQAGGAVAQRAINIKKPKGNYANLPGFKKKPLFKQLMGDLGERGVDLDRALYHLSQMFSAEDDLDFETLEQFEEALMYDVANKSVEGEEHTLQEQYMTKYGWRKRAKAKEKGGPALPPGERQLKVYRTMPVTEYQRLLDGDPKALEGGHLGDFKQAQAYLYRDPNPKESKVLVEFVLAEGAERELFSPEAMAFPAKKHNRVIPNLLKQTLIDEGAEDAFAEANVNEGTAPDRVGIKSELGEAGFSLGIGGGTSAELFLSKVTAMNALGQRDPK